MGIAVTGGIVPVFDLNGSPQIQAGRDSRSATRVMHTSWANLEALMLEVFPAAPALPGLYPGASFMYADTLTFEPLHPDGDQTVDVSAQIATYGLAKVTINYSKLPYEPSTLITRRYSFSGEYLTLPNGSLFWFNSETGPADPGPPERFEVADAEEMPAAKIIPMIEHSIMWHRVREDAIPRDAIKDNIGKVNEFDLDTAYFPSVSAETLLYMGAELNFTFSTDGSQVWTLEHRFQERRVKQGSDVFGWNHFLRPRDGKWKKLLTNTHQDYTVYPLSNDFAALFGA